MHITGQGDTKKASTVLAEKLVCRLGACERVTGGRENTEVALTTDAAMRHACVCVCAIICIWYVYTCAYAPKHAPKHTPAHVRPRVHKSKTDFFVTDRIGKT